MKRLNLVYWTLRDNYGDYLSPFIVHNLSGLNIQQKDVAYLQKPWKSVLQDIFLHGNLNLRLSHRFLPFEKKNYVCIGSILGQGNKNSHYWGTGFLRKGKCRGFVYAVRGSLSRDCVLNCRKEGLVKIIGDLPVGDPALLLPMFLPPANHKKFQLGIIPHYTEYEIFKKQYGHKYFIINVASSDVVRITEEITSCEYILSTSLHGLIVPHAYNIPALWIEHSELQPGSDGFKFKDYFSSIGISYEPFREISNILDNENGIISFFQKNMKIALPQVDMSYLRNKLLGAAPFPLKNEFRNI